ncbi:hypothetical protein Tco_0773682 [Tanacetum coccineum]|uniref:Uncharacterized protein n=1 Tax=Tanacetum coccineum TaxID=301880 RepID=A0ABQ4ZNN3_9ASTR
MKHRGGKGTGRGTRERERNTPRGPPTRGKRMNMTWARGKEAGGARGTSRWGNTGGRNGKRGEEGGEGGRWNGGGRGVEHLGGREPETGGRRGKVGEGARVGRQGREKGGNTGTTERNRKRDRTEWKGRVGNITEGVNTGVEHGKAGTSGGGGEHGQRSEGMGITRTGGGGGKGGNNQENYMGNGKKDKERNANGGGAGKGGTKGNWGGRERGDNMARVGELEGKEGREGGRKRKYLVRGERTGERWGWKAERRER